jgi:WD40 repeat protein
VAFDPQGRRIVSGSYDGTVRVWDVDSGRELACLSGHEGEVQSVAFDPRGRRIVSGSWDGTVRVWDVDSGACLEVIPGCGDIAAMAAGAVAFPFQAIELLLETAIKRASDGQSVAWFPAALRFIATHPSGRVWAGAVGNHLYLIRLEGVEEGRGTMTGGG